MTKRTPKRPQVTPSPLYSHTAPILSHGYTNDIMGADTSKQLGHLAQPSEFRRLLETLLRTPLWLDWVRQHSYQHANGFSKIVLGQNTDGARLRLHLWQKRTSGQSDIHDHFWDYCSAVLFGSGLQHRSYKVITGGSVSFYTHHKLIPGSNGNFTLTPSFASGLDLMELNRQNYEPGDVSVHDHKTLHSFEQTLDAPAATLVLHGPKVSKENSVYRKAHKPMESNGQVKPFTQAQLQERLGIAMDMLSR